METKTELEIREMLNRLVIRLLTTSLFIFLYRNIGIVRYFSDKITYTAFTFIHLIERFKDFRYLDISHLKSLSAMVLGIIMLLPIFKTLTSEISSDTIYLYFLICQIINCVASVKISILRSSSSLIYTRETTIPLDESLLIGKKLSFSSHMAGIAVSLSFILIFSRLDNINDMIVLQTLGFILYFFIPEILDSFNNPTKIIWIRVIMILVGIIMAVLDLQCFYYYVIAVAVIYWSMRLLISIGIE